jgi:putative SbcD/Mre11-related phosphoesterase
LIIPLRPHPALLLKKGTERILVVADLHIGWEVQLAEKGIYVSSQTPKLQEKMLQLIQLCKPTSLLFLGDVKHAIAKVAMEEWRDIPNFFETLSKKVQNIQISPGNHDGNLEPLLPQNVKMLPSTGIALGSVGFFHGHTWPSPNLLNCPNLITAHVHPTVTFRDPIGFRITRQVWMKAPCNSKKLAKSILKHLRIKGDKDPILLLRKQFKVKLRTSQLLIMPSFNDFLGGQSINRKTLGKSSGSRAFIGPILRSKSVDIDNAEAHLLDGTFLGTVKHLRNLI